MKRTRTIAIDFDGCLVTNKYPDIGEPIKETIEAYKKEKAAGSKIILWTCRTGNNLQAALDWCSLQGIVFDAVNENTAEQIAMYGEDTRKINADEYWDDKAVKMPTNTECNLQTLGKKDVMFMTVTKGRLPNPLVMRRLSDNAAEIELYGCIVEKRPTNFWGEPEEGQFIVLGDFLEELKALEQVEELTVRIHSAGGDAYAAMVIHNRLKSLAARVTVVVDGVAMSGGSLIMCAGDKVQVYPSSLIMIHDCWAWLCGGYGAEELARIIERNKSVDRMQIEIYKGKTGLAATALQEMMDKETHMTGREAVEQGFADEVLEGESGVQIAASVDRNTLFVEGMPVWQARGHGCLPLGLTLPVIDIAAEQKVKTNGGNKVMVNNVEELKQEYPELTKQLEETAKAEVGQSGQEALTAAMEAERRRLQEIDQVAGLFDADLVQAAKYGDTACTAQELAYRAAQKAAEQGKAFLEAMQKDNQASGAQGVQAMGSDPVGGGNDDNLTPEARKAEAKASVKALLGKAEQ